VGSGHDEEHGDVVDEPRERTGAACEAVRGLDGRDQLADVIVIRERVLVFGKRATFGRHIGIASS